MMVTMCQRSSLGHPLSQSTTGLLPLGNNDTLTGLWETDLASALVWDFGLQSGRIVYRFDRPTAPVPSWSWISLIRFPVGPIDNHHRRE